MNMFEPNQSAPQDPYAIAIRVLRDLASSFAEQANTAYSIGIVVTFRHCAEETEALVEQLEARQRKQQ